MISTKEAIAIAEECANELTSEKVRLKQALNRVLALDAIAKIDLPPFNQSAMDGYAVRLHESDSFKVIGEVKAGDDASKIELNPGEAIKIFTGAMCPKSADLVCRIEDIEESENIINIKKMPSAGANIRLEGEQIRIGETGLSKGSLINAAAIGLLANLGIGEVDVYLSPKIGIISTGNELIKPNEENNLPPGKVFESNGVMLEAAIKNYDFISEEAQHIKDEYAEVVDGLKKALDNNDVLLITGGISVGDYDFVGKALIELGVEQKFYKVNQKPGKPLFFGTKGKKLIFALPGNPAAALTCFYIYVLPALRKMSGKGFTGLTQKKAVLTSDIARPNSREQFLKAHLQENEVSVLEGQSSAMLRSFAESNALVYLPANTTPSKGELVNVILLD